mmetsp:Transcript_97081/g.153063  ORF Transcript_97081/g.153063 Transcript_97081/m.153063 type:complete len:106 (+) Transcript_97081:962-1279(+)
MGRNFALLGAESSRRTQGKETDESDSKYALSYHRAIEVITKHEFQEFEEVMILQVVPQMQRIPWRCYFRDAYLSMAHVMHLQMKARCRNPPCSANNSSACGLCVV